MGMLLENGGRKEPNGFHWEASILKDELMTAQNLDLDMAVVSDFTVALLNDTGWYDVVIYWRDEMTWGQSRGCDFFNL